MHLPLSCSISNIGIPGFIYVGVIFSTVNITSHTTCWDFARSWSPGWGVGTVAFRLFSVALFTRGQYWPSGIVVACVCVSACLSVNHELVRAIIHQPFKLGSPNLDRRCKRTWLRSLLFCGVIDGDLQGQIELESQNLPHFWLVSLSGR